MRGNAPLTVRRLLPKFVRYLTLLFTLALAACAMNPEERAAQAEREFGATCEKQGFARGSEKWRACVDDADLKAAVARQRAYEQDFLRQRDCVEPLAGCGGQRRH